MTTTPARMQQRRRTAAQWAAENPVLAAGEFGDVTDSTPPGLALGDGTTAFNSLTGISVVGSLAVRDGVRIMTEDDTFDAVLFGFENTLDIGVGRTLTLLGGTSYRGVLFAPTIVYDDPSPFSGGRSIEDSAILKNPPGVAKTMPHQTAFYSAATVRGDGALFTTSRSAFLDPGAYDTINGGTVTADHMASFDSAMAIGAGVTANIRRGLRVLDATGVGTLTTQVGVDILPLAKGATNIGIRNASTEVDTPQLQALVAATQITPTARIKRITATGAITLSANPIIADGENGQIITLFNSSANAITFTRTTQGLRLGAATRILNQYDTLTLIYSTDLAEWIEIGFADNA